MLTKVWNDMFSKSSKLLSAGYIYTLLQNLKFQRKSLPKKCCSIKSSGETDISSLIRNVFMYWIIDAWSALLYIRDVWWPWGRSPKGHQTSLIYSNARITKHLSYLKYGMMYLIFINIFEMSSFSINLLL